MTHRTFPEKPGRFGDTHADTPDWAAPALDAAVAVRLLFRGVRLFDVAARLGGAPVYLATPYSRLAVTEAGHFDAALSRGAGESAARWAAVLADLGLSPISPVAQSVAMLAPDGLTRWPALDPLDHAFWMAHWRPWLAVCAAVVIPPLPGWRQSVGIWQEATQALAWGKRVFLIEEGDGCRTD